MNNIIIDEEIIQQEVEQELGRQLNPYEISQVRSKLCENLWLFIRESINEIIKSNETL